MHKLRGLVLGFVVWVIYKLLSMTWKINLCEPEDFQKNLHEKKPMILAHFHGDEIPLISLASRYQIATMTSTSKDGEMMNTVLKLLGAKTSRGSSTRGGIGALKGLIQFCKNGSNCSMAVDGPRGPIYEVKPGVFELARLVKAPIFAGAVSCDRAWRFPRSWNQAYLPKPFAQVSIVWLPFQTTIDKSVDPRNPELANSLKNQLFDARGRSAKFIVG